MRADAVIVGGGVAGLAAAQELTAAGLGVELIEARSRLGGRVWTHHRDGGPPFEWGAEFIHGRPPGLWALARQADARPVESAGRRWLARGGRIEPDDECWETIEAIDGQIPAGPEVTYAEFLETAHASAVHKAAAAAYAEGFNAARADVLSAQAVAKMDEASASIQGEKAYRLPQGYDGLVQRLAEGLPSTRRHLRSVARRLRWSREGVEMECDTPAGARIFEARRAVITVPLGVLRAAEGARGAIRFEPALPSGKLDALGRLEMGHVQRFALEFEERFWVERGFPGGFLIAPEEAVPTWWTQAPLESDLLIGWAGGPAAERLAGLDDPSLRARGLEALARIFGLEVGWLEGRCRALHRHDWSGDPFARGAYSYPGVGGLAAARILAEPVGGVLYFAGEATDFAGHAGTVHAALESGYRAAREIVAGSAR